MLMLIERKSIFFILNHILHYVEREKKETSFIAMVKKCNNHIYGRKTVSGYFIDVFECILDYFKSSQILSTINPELVGKT